MGDFTFQHGNSCRFAMLFLFQITIHLLDTIFPQSYDSNEQFVIQRAENFSGRFFVGVFRLH